MQELRYYREAVFVPQPGPDSATAREIAARYTEPGAADGAAGRDGGRRQHMTRRCRGPLYF